MFFAALQETYISTTNKSARGPFFDTGILLEPNWSLLQRRPAYLPKSFCVLVHCSDSQAKKVLLPFLKTIVSYGTRLKEWPIPTIPCEVPYDTRFHKPLGPFFDTGILLEPNWSLLQRRPAYLPKSFCVLVHCSDSQAKKVLLPFLKTIVSYGTRLKEWPPYAKYLLRFKNFNKTVHPLFRLINSVRVIPITYMYLIQSLQKALFCTKYLLCFKNFSRKVHPLFRLIKSVLLIPITLMYYTQNLRKSVFAKNTSSVSKISKEIYTLGFVSWRRFCWYQ